MKYTILIDQAAILDIQDTLQWYDSQKPGLGTEYYEEFKYAAKRLGNNPLVNRKRFKSIRKVQVGSRFPFFIYYVLDKNIITIIGVLHGGRNPEIWKEREKSD